MLKLHIHPEDLHHPDRWRPTPTGWATGRSTLTPYSHPCLESRMSMTEGRTLMVIRERVRGRLDWNTSTDYVTADEYTQRAETVHDWPLGFLTIELTAGKARIQASKWGCAPVHLATADGTLRGSWDMLDLVDHVDPGRLDPLSVVRFLTYANYYSSATLLADVVTLTERATATYTGADVQITYPEPGMHALPRELRPDADPVAAFEQVLAGVVDRWEVDPDHTVADVSGGMDSTNVALSLAQLYPGRVGTGAMLLPGAMGKQQRRRRSEFLAHGFGPDHTVEMAEHLPFAPDGPRRRGVPFDPDEGPYAEARDVLLQDYASAGKRVLFTGLGGDEAMKLRRAEREALGLTSHSPLRHVRGVPAFLGPRGRELLPHRFEGAAPLGPTLWSILACFSAIYPQHMRHGIWPITPFAAPEVVRLAESLPAEWRSDKRLLRDRLARAGFSRDVSHPELKETFQEVLDLSMRRHGSRLLRDLLDEGALLVEEGYLDGEELHRSAAEFEATGGRTFDVYRPLILEVGVRSLRGRTRV
ncbi:asparagine synthetase B family protein [Nocardiopsis salina]|uniref:hypothetical protein n=1 Tax=Nocardiopsis salina TaxID=245836 RepID=UPI00034B71D7|nr:hypothetical protein [Nocardiopsis salina]